MRISTALILLGLVGSAAPARAELLLNYNFDSVASGTAASTFDSPAVSIHNASKAFRQDADGIDIPGTEHWSIDAALDAFSPVTVSDPSLDGFGAAPSGLNALNAYAGPVFLKFDRAYDLTGFSAVLDWSTLGDLGASTIWFVTDFGVRDILEFDAGVPGAALAKGRVSAVTGIVLQGGSYYDDLTLRLAPVPEPSTYGLMGVAALLVLVAARRFRRTEPMA